jgi:hypothetical protein
VDAFAPPAEQAEDPDRLATVAVPIVMYGLMPRLHRLRVRLLVRRAG